MEKLFINEHLFKAILEASESKMKQMEWRIVYIDDTNTKRIKNVYAKNRGDAMKMLGSTLRKDGRGVKEILSID